MNKFFVRSSDNCAIFRYHRDDPIKKTHHRHNLKINTVLYTQNGVKWRRRKRMSVYGIKLGPFSQHAHTPPYALNLGKVTVKL